MKNSINHTQWNDIYEEIKRLGKTHVYQTIANNWSHLSPDWQVVKWNVQEYTPHINLTFVHKPIKNRSNAVEIYDSQDYPRFLKPEELNGLNTVLCELTESLKQVGLIIKLDTYYENTVHVAGEKYSSGKLHYKIKPKDYLAFWQSIQK